MGSTVLIVSTVFFLLFTLLYLKEVSMDEKQIKEMVNQCNKLSNNSMTFLEGAIDSQVQVLLSAKKLLAEAKELVAEIAKLSAESFE